MHAGADPRHPTGPERPRPSRIRGRTAGLRPGGVDRRRRARDAAPVHSRRAGWLGDPLGAARRPRRVPRRGRGRQAPRATGPARGGRGRRRPDAAGRGGDGVVRGPTVRGPLGHAAADGGPALPRRRLPAVRSPRVRRHVGAGHGGAADPARCRRRGAGLGRSLPRVAHRRPRGPGRRGPPRGGGGDGAVVLGRDRRQPAAGQDRHRVRQARGDLPADQGRLGRGDGRPLAGRAVGHRAPDGGQARRPGHHHGGGAGPGRSGGARRGGSGPRWAPGTACSRSA